MASDVSFEPYEFSGKRIVLVEHPRNWAAYRALELLRLCGAELLLVSAEPLSYGIVPDSTVQPLTAIFESVVLADTSDWVSVRDAISSKDADAVLSFSHHYCASAAVVDEALGSGLRRATAIGLACQKDRLRERLADLDYNLDFAVVTSERDARDAMSALTFPVVVKPLDDCSSNDVVIAHDLPEVFVAMRRVQAVKFNRKGIRRDRRVLMEELAVGPEFSVETFTSRSRTEVYGITQKLPHKSNSFVEQADSFPFRDSAGLDEAVASAAVAALARVGGHLGPAHIEVRATTGGPKIIEINPRQGGGHITTMIEAVTGRNVFLDTVAMLLGAEVRNCFPPKADAATWWQIYDGPKLSFDSTVRAVLPARLEFLHDSTGPTVAFVEPQSNRDCRGSMLVLGDSIVDTTLAAMRGADANRG